MVNFHSIPPMQSDEEATADDSYPVEYVTDLSQPKHLARDSNSLNYLFVGQPFDL